MQHTMPRPDVGIIPQQYLQQEQTCSHMIITPFLLGVWEGFRVNLKFYYKFQDLKVLFCKSCKFALFDFKFLSLCTVYLIIIFRVQK